MLGKNDKVTCGSDGLFETRTYPAVGEIVGHYGGNGAMIWTPDILKTKNIKTITICGSMTFAEEMKEQELKLTKNGYIVFMPIFCDEKETTDADMLVYRESHREKIKMSDAIFVINKGGYVGRDTASEIELASKMCKRICFFINANDEML